MPGRSCHTVRAALIVDHPQRDLAGLVLVACHLASEGVTSLLVPMNLQHKEIFAWRPEFVLLNYLRRNNESFAAQCAQLKISFGILDTEGAVLQSPEAFARVMAKDPSVRGRAAFFCSWGPQFAARAVEAQWYRADQIVVTGSPRLDAYAPGWRRMALDGLNGFSGDNGIPFSPDAPLVLVNGNFPVANPLFQTPKEERRMYVERFGMEEKTVRTLQQTQRRTLEELVQMTNRLAARFPEVQFIYRPHPFERVETYRPLLEELPNLHLIKSGAVDGWILRCRAVIQRSCSTAIEAAMAGVPALSPRWIPAHLQPLAEAVSLPCGSQEELAHTLEAILQGRFQMPVHIRQELDRVIRDWFFRIDGHAHERVAARILQTLSERAKGKVSVRWNPYAWRRLRGDTWRSAIGATFRGPSGRGEPSSPGWEESEKFFDAPKVEKLVKVVPDEGKGRCRISVERMGHSVGIFQQDR